MNADAARFPGSFRALGRRLVQESFPAMDAEEIEGYLDRAEQRVRQASGPRPKPPSNPAEPSAARQPSKSITPPETAAPGSSGISEVQAGDRLLTAEEVSALFRVSQNTVARWIALGRISLIRTPDGHQRFSESEVRALLASDIRDNLESRNMSGGSGGSTA